jgi:catechol 2,3-dioxygenase-like lactoylglutathione lyase family enzyme
MSEPPASQLLRSAPYFPVADLAQATRFYSRTLGFWLEYVGGDPPEFAIVTRDGLSIMLRAVAADAPISPNERQGGTWDAFFWVRDVRALFTEVSAAGAEVVYGPVLQPAYGMEEFAVRDPSGYILGFGQPLVPDGPGQWYEP